MKAAIMGYGTIGSGVAKILSENSEVIKRRVGEPIELKSVLDLREFEGDPIQKYIVHDYKLIADDPEIKLVVETMGGVEPAFTFVKAMLESGKHVTTSNKNLVAEKGAELIKIAKENNVNFFFEASVGGGIPIIRTLLKCTTGDIIEHIYGILNGTTNYMLTKMREDNEDYSAALREAQEKGYAEKDPTADVEGLDPARKIAILTSLVAEQQVDFNDIPTEGISKITPEDIQYAEKLGMKIKLVASMDESDDSYFARVAPFLVGKDSPLYTVEDVYNAILVHGNMLGDAMFYGSGAGSLPTASAVVGDLVEMAKHVMRHVDFTWNPEKLELKDPDVQEYRFFVRSSKSIDELKSVFGGGESVDGVVEGESGFVTPVLSEKSFKEKKDEAAVKSFIRLL